MYIYFVYLFLDKSINFIWLFYIANWTNCIIPILLKEFNEKFKYDNSLHLSNMFFTESMLSQLIWLFLINNFCRFKHVYNELLKFVKSKLLI